MSVDSPSPRLGLSGSDADVAASAEGSNWYGLMFLSLGLKASDNWLASSPEISTLKPSKVKSLSSQSRLYRPSPNAFIALHLGTLPNQ